MNKWIKNAVMMTVLSIWTVYMLAYLIGYFINTIDELPPPALWGVPGGVWLALNPPFIKKQEKVQELE